MGLFTVSLVKKSYFLFAYVINESPVDSFFELTTELVAQKNGRTEKTGREPGWNKKE